MDKKEERKAYILNEENSMTAIYFSEYDSVITEYIINISSNYKP